MEGPTRVPLEDLGRPAANQPLVELRFVNENGNTEVWMLKREMLDFEGLSNPTRVRLAYLDRGVDSRLATQAESINRLQAHVNQHHNELHSEYETRIKGWACTYQDPS
jgi:hypothetical protein